LTAFSDIELGLDSVRIGVCLYYFFFFIYFFYFWLRMLD